MNYNIELKGHDEGGVPIVSINDYITGYLMNPKQDQITGTFVVTTIKENIDGNYNIPNAICYKKKLYRTSFSYSRNTIFGNQTKINNINIDNVESITNSLFIYNKCLYCQHSIDNISRLIMLFDSYNKSYLEIYPNTAFINDDFCFVNNSIEYLILHNVLLFQHKLYNKYISCISELNKFINLNKIIIGNKIVYKKNNKWKLEQNLF